MKLWPRPDDVPEAEGRLVFEFFWIGIVIAALCFGAWLLQLGD